MKMIKEKHPFHHIAYVFLPDHLHWLLEPSPSTNISKIIAAVKREVTWRMKEQQVNIKPLWQPRFYDHVIRDEDDFARHLDYIHFNPVKHGLVQATTKYPHSSFAAWVERGVYTKEWGSAKQPPKHIVDMDLE
jgi:putative transposase